jgi:hypothetical protein
MADGRLPRRPDGDLWLFRWRQCRRPGHGRLTIDGAPAANVLVNFLPTEGGNSAFATTDASGRFTVQTTRTVVGLAPGEYRVTVQPGDEDSGSTVSPVPEKYQSERTSDLRVSVSEGAKNELKIELSSSG